MYIGNNGTIGLFVGIIHDCIKICRTDNILFTISILKNNNFSFSISASNDLLPFIQSFNLTESFSHDYFPSVLKILSTKFDIIEMNTCTKVLINFELDTSILKNTNVEYQKLSESVLQITLLNRGTEIIIKDTRQKYINQNYFSFTQGIFYLFDRAKNEVLGKPEFQVTFDDKVGDNKYQIALAYRTDWYPNPLIKSFANDVNTICGGTLVDGIIDGLLIACKKYVTDNNLTTFKIKRKKLYNGLIIICSVRGQNFEYGGSFRETLEDKSVKVQAKKIITKLVSDNFKKDLNIVNNFLWRFDEQRFTSRMY